MIERERKGGKGWPCLKPLTAEIFSLGSPLIKTEKFSVETTSYPFSPQAIKAF